MKLFTWSNGFLVVLSAEPVVILMKDYLFKKPGKAQWLILQSLRRRRAHILVGLSWTVESAGKADYLAKKVGRYLRRHRHHRVTILTNTINEKEILDAKGLETLYCSASAFLSESIFFPIDGGHKEFDAVYDAAVSPYKRLELAQKVRSLALIAYRKGSSTPRYVNSTMQLLEHANWLNGKPDREMQWLTYEAVNRDINRARVGLCLSAEEGSMNASAQYLLAGLPVVTTRSLGGRDVFYDPAYVREVPDDPKAVACAVDDFCAAPPSQELIRGNTLEKITEHRARFMQLMRDILAGNDPDGVWDKGWPGRMPHKFYGGDFTVRENLDALKNPQLGAPWLTAG